MSYYINLYLWTKSRYEKNLIEMICFPFQNIGTGIIQYYLSIQSINFQLQRINGVILDGVMSIKMNDLFENQIKSINNRFYMYLSKCQNDIKCANAFKFVTNTDQDIITVTLTLQRLFFSNMTNPLCTTNLGLKNWVLFSLIVNQGIEPITTRPIAAILIARIYRCSAEDQRVLSQALPILLRSVEQSLSSQLIDPPDKYQDDGSVLDIVTIWSDFVGRTVNENIKTNSTFFNNLCINVNAINEFSFAPIDRIPLCHETQISTNNYSIPSVFQDILYSKNPRYWSQFKINPEIFQSRRGNVLMFNGDLDANTPMHSAHETQLLFQSENIRTKLVEMKDLTHVTSIQSYMKDAVVRSATCTEQIIVQFLYQQELNLDLETIDYNCSLKENLFGIDWFYSNPVVNATLYQMFGGSTTNYWGINITFDEAIKPISNHSSGLSFDGLFIFLFMIIFSCVSFVY